MQEHSQIEWVDELELPRNERHSALADLLFEAIRTQKIPPGTRLPTHRELAGRLRTSVSTVTRAYRELARRRVVEATVGRGTFVTLDRSAIWQSENAAQKQPGGQSAPLEALNIPLLHRGDLTDLSLNEPLPSLSRKCVETGLTLLARNGDPTALSSYHSSVGTGRHRAAGAKWLGEIGITLDQQELVVVPGGQSALTAVLLGLCGGGGTVLTEDLSWPGLLSVASAIGVRVVAVETDDDGIVPDALDAALCKEDARVLYTMPTLHNPTGTTTSLARRETIARLCAAKSTVILEDDAYGFAASERPPSYLALAPGHTVYLTSLSKPLTPALRVAYLVSQPSVLRRVISVLRATTLMTSPIVAEIATRLIESGEALELARSQADVARKRQGLARQAGLGDLARDVSEGMHVWMPVGPQWRTQDFVAQALPLGVSVSPGTVFSATPGFDPQAVRICLNAVESETALVAAFARLTTLKNVGDGFSAPFF